MVSGGPDLARHSGELSAGVRPEVAELINAEPDDVAFAAQTTERLKWALLTLNPGTNVGVVSIDLEFPAVSSMAISF